MKILVIAPHMDDEVLGMGGTIAKHVDYGDVVYVVIVAHRVYNRVYDPELNQREKECTEKAKNVLGYKEVKFLNLPDERLDLCVQDILIPLEEYYCQVGPDVLYTNFKGDNHQDHRAIFEAVRIFARSAADHRVKKFLMYEVPSATEQSPPILESLFMPNFYVNVENFLDRKIQASRCYVTERRSFPHPRSEEALTILAQRRGIEAGFKAAEAFMILRDQWD